MQQPLLILAPPRSFTTVVCAMLGNHAEMFGLAETNLFLADTVAELAARHQAKPRLSHGLLRSLSELAFASQTEEDIEAAKTWLAGHQAMPTGEVFKMLADLAGSRSLIDKSPSHVYAPGALERMKAAFPDAYYLHLTRHPYGTFRSVNELRERIGKATERMTGGLQTKNSRLMVAQDVSPDSVWLAPHRSILAFLETIAPERQLRMRGEDLLSDPEPHLASIARWFGKRDDDASVSAMLHPERSPFAVPGPANARFGNDPNFMENPQLRRYKPREQPLEEVDQATHGFGFSPELIACAKFLGY